MEATTDAASANEARIADILKKEKKNAVSRQFAVVGDFWTFMKVRKKWWLLPIIITLMLVGVLIVFGHASPLAPFIYALF